MTASRTAWAKARPAAFQAMMALQTAANRSEIEQPVMELVKLRASQLNGCAFCLDMHAADATKAGEDPRRLHVLPAWREAADWFTPREQAALTWTEALTLLTAGHVPDAVYEQASAQFSPQELADLSLAVVAINGWNRLQVAFRAAPPALLQRARSTEASGVGA